MVLDLYSETLELLAELERRSLPYALAGGIALAIHGLPRATVDIDLLVPPGSVAEVLAVAHGLGFVVPALAMRFESGLEIRRVCKIAGEDTLPLDLLLVADILMPVWEARVRVPTERGQVWVVSRDGLIRMKCWAGRAQDLADVRRLHELDA